MSQQHHSFYDPSTGAFSGQQVVGSANAVRLNTPPGLRAIEGQHDHLSKRVDLATGQVVDWQPPAPPNTDLQTWEWDASSEPRRPRWRARPTLLARTQQAQAAIDARIGALEARQARPVRELALNPGQGNQAAMAALQALEHQIDALRLERLNPTLQPEPALPSPPQPRP